MPPSETESTVCDSKIVTFKTPVSLHNISTLSSVAQGCTLAYQVWEEPVSRSTMTLLYRLRECSHKLVMVSLFKSSKYKFLVVESFTQVPTSDFIPVGTFSPTPLKSGTLSLIPGLL